MIESVGQVMLYVNDIEKAALFWKEKIGFERVERQEQGSQISYRLAPKLDSEVELVLHSKEEVAKMNPEMNLGTPSILMTSKDLDKTYQEFTERGVVAHPIVDLGFLKVFNFSDEEGNYFAIRQIEG